MLDYLDIALLLREPLKDAVRGAPCWEDAYLADARGSVALRRRERLS